MLESPVQIQRALAITGEVLSFPEVITYDALLIPTVVRPAFSIQAIPGATIYNIKGYDAQSFDIQNKDVVFRGSVVDYMTNNIAIGDTFSYTPSNTPNRTFTFQITDSIDDMTGWMQLDVSLTRVS